MFSYSWSRDYQNTKDLWRRYLGNSPLGGDAFEDRKCLVFGVTRRSRSVDVSQSAYIDFSDVTLVSDDTCDNLAIAYDVLLVAMFYCHYFKTK